MTTGMPASAALAALRALRKQLADERHVPAYIIFGDTTLRALAHFYPTSLAQLEGIPGIGEKKRAEMVQMGILDARGAARLRPTLPDLLVMPALACLVAEDEAAEAGGPGLQRAAAGQ